MKLSRFLLVVSFGFAMLVSACNIPAQANVEIIPTLVSGDADGEMQTVVPEDPTEEPTGEPTLEPTVKPTTKPAAKPTVKPTVPRVDPIPVSNDPDPVQPTKKPPLDSLNTFAQKLTRAVENRDFDRMRALMGDRFSIATFNTQLMNYPSDQALDMLRADKFAPGSTPAVRPGTDVVMLLNGADPLGLWGPVDNPVRASHVMGLASNGDEEGVLVIGREEGTGKFYWLGILLPEDRYFRSEGPGDVMETDVQWVEALEELNARSGPGLNYAVEGRLRQGEIARVTGKSASGQWWRISCTQDISGNCWISAASELSRPASPPQ